MLALDKLLDTNILPRCSHNTESHLAPAVCICLFFNDCILFNPLSENLARSSISLPALFQVMIPWDAIPEWQGTKWEQGREKKLLESVQSLALENAEPVSV